jgi:uncharacterized protein YjiS (DUF1127 family)
MDYIINIRFQYGSYLSIYIKKFDETGETDRQTRKDQTMTAIDRTYARPARTSVLKTLKAVYDTWQQRQALKSLDAAALEDIGVSARAAQSEASKPIWDVPQTWRC